MQWITELAIHCFFIYITLSLLHLPHFPADEVSLACRQRVLGIEQLVYIVHRQCPINVGHRREILKGDVLPFLRGNVLSSL